MADFMFNRAKGRVVQFAELIEGSVAPYTNAAFIVSLWRRGASTDDTLNNYDDVTALEGDANAAELTSGVNAGYVRKTVDEAGVSIVYDDTANDVDVSIPNQTWTTLGAGGAAITDLLVAFDNDTTAGTDANQVPCTFHAFAVTADGSDVTAQVGANGFTGAS